MPYIDLEHTHQKFESEQEFHQKYSDEALEYVRWHLQTNEERSFRR